MGITRQSLTGSGEEHFIKNYRRAGIKVLKDVMINDMGFDLDDVEGYTKPELLDILKDYMGYSKGGLTKTGHTDYRKTGLFK
tara:strand:+ start:1105 stop:1350 length:246 start_codon:yes stop_codon:yes gene_type:complete